MQKEHFQFRIPIIFALDSSEEDYWQYPKNARYEHKVIILRHETPICSSDRNRLSGCREMARYIRMLVSDAALRKRLGQAGRRNIETYFTLEKSIEVIRGLLEEAAMPSTPS